MEVVSNEEFTELEVTLEAKDLKPHATSGHNRKRHYLNALNMQNSNDEPDNANYYYMSYF